MKKTIIIYLFLLFNFVSLYPQDINIISTGYGLTKSDAVLSALREAVSQASGSFISGKTSVDINDLVEDKTVMLTNGCVKTYKELKEYTDNKITLDVLVSLSDVIKYVNNKGSNVYVNGKEFVSNYVLSNVNKKSCDGVIDNFIEQLYSIGQTMYDYKIKLGKPYIKNNNVYVNVNVYCLQNKQLETFTSIYNKSIENINKYINIDKDYTRKLNIYNQVVSNLYRLCCYNFVITDNLGNEITCDFYEKPLLENKKFSCFEKFYDGGRVYCKSNNVEISRGNIPVLDYGHNNGSISFTLKYPLNDFNELTDININPKF